MSIDLEKPDEREARLARARDDLVAHIRGLPRRPPPTEPRRRPVLAGGLLPRLVRGLTRHLLRRLFLLAASLAAAQFLLPGGVPDLAFVPAAMWQAVTALGGP